MRCILFCVFVLFWIDARSQALYENLPFHRATVHLGENTAVVEFRPVRSEPLPDPARTYYWYRTNKVNKTQGGFAGKLLNGRYIEYYANKNLREAGSFKMGLKNGIWSVWSPSGRLSVKQTWRSGELRGKFSRFDSLGAVVEKGTYRGGKIDGRHLRYLGDSVVTSHYRSGEIFQPKRRLQLIPNTFNRLKGVLKKRKRVEKE